MRSLLTPNARSRRAIELIAELEARRLLAAAPSLSLAQTITVPAGKTIQVPIAGTASGGSSISYTVGGGSSAGISTKFHDSHDPTLQLDTSLGSLQFELLADVAPNTVRKIIGLVNAGYYTSQTFHRVVNVNGLQFAQGGDPNQDGTGGPQFTFDDEFDPDAIFSGTGQLATANTAAGATGKDANGSAFIITDSAARPFDFNHTIFGQLTRGGKTLDSIVNVPTTGFRPNDTIRITDASIVKNNTDAVLQVKAGTKLGETTVTVTARDSVGRETKRDIAVTVVKDASDSPPILEPIKPISAMPGQTVVIPVKAIDLEGEDYDIGGDYAGNELAMTRIDQLQKQIVVTLAADAKGPIELLIGVKGDGAVDRGNITVAPGTDERYIASGIYDTQKFVISVGDLSVNNLAADEDPIISTPYEKIDDIRIATFRAAGEDIPGASHFKTQIDWGDGLVTHDAHVREINNGQFAVYGTHQYNIAGTLPVTVDVTADNGSSARLETDVKVAPPLQLVDRTLFVTGTDGDDHLVVSRDDNGDVAIQNQTWPASDVDRIDVNLRGGDDSLDANVTSGLPDMIVDCGSGNDSVSAGPGDDTINGGDGDDQLGGNGGNDLINAGDGNDTLLGGSGKNVLNGEAGDDRVTGGNGRDFIYGGDGNDRLYGRGGDDVIDAGAGVDRLYGEDGNDLLIGGSGNDRAYGGAGEDILYGKAGVDTLNGGPDKDQAGDGDSHDILVDL